MDAEPDTDHRQETHTMRTITATGATTPNLPLRTMVEDAARRASAEFCDTGWYALSNPDQDGIITVHFRKTPALRFEISREGRALRVRQYMADGSYIGDYGIISTSRHIAALVGDLIEVCINASAAN